MTVIGSGLAGSEAAWQLARFGVPVRLYEMRPHVMPPAHTTDRCAELVCSNSFRAADGTSAAGTLKRELRSLGSLVMQAADESSVPAGSALAVDRLAFAERVTERVTRHRLIDLMREEVTSLPDGRVIIATGPLTSSAMEAVLTALTGPDRLAFYDAAAPIVAAESIDLSVAFPASRYDKGQGADYLNCPLSQQQYDSFVALLRDARCVTRRAFERAELFHACQPVEEVARSGHDTLRFGAMKPVGLLDPRSGERPWAVVQLRPENLARTAFNLVGFQTGLTFAEQRRVLRTIPGLKDAEFLRYGVVHRNTFVDSPRLLDPTLAVRHERRVRLAGQITGTEGYLEAAASGLIAALNTVCDLHGHPPFVLPRSTALGALLRYATDVETTEYQPMHVNWGFVPPLHPPVRGKRARYQAYSHRAADDLAKTLAAHPLTATERP
ncbi:MAG TPA: methylenetetrahydrofolate--tRNA-(uracil(54)-C(5))-methyltransferase (FADH(2)-oxidizing) TrmFO [Coriobacteriia bacterium]|nr:methylenetetrahydrofolate--tRNA-(uracil(54)-C(5))-methyltransferase (FADH(2)-oxidizing) TrmFO [Coriobacteriia bacterium]